MSRPIGFYWIELRRSGCEPMLTVAHYSGNGNWHGAMNQDIKEESVTALEWLLPPRKSTRDGFGGAAVLTAEQQPALLEP